MELVLVGHDVLLAGELGDPETVDHVVALEIHDNGRVHRHAHLVSSGNELAGLVSGDRVFVAELPPPLVAHRLDPNRLLALGSRQGNCLARFKLEQDNHRPHAQSEDQDGRHDGPGDFQRRVPVGLRRQRIPRLPAKTDRRVEQRAFDQHEHDHHGPQEHVEQQQLFPRHRATDPVQRPRRGTQNGLVAFSVATQSRENQDAAKQGQRYQGTPSETAGRSVGGGVHWNITYRSGPGTGAALVG